MLMKETVWVAKNIKSSSHEVPQQTPMIKGWAKKQGYAALGFTDSLLDCDGSLVFLLSCLKMRQGYFFHLPTCTSAPVCKQQLDLKLTKNSPSKVEGRSNLLNHTPQTSLLVPALHYRTSSQKPFPKAKSNLAACCQTCLHPKSSTAFLKIPSCLAQKDEVQSSLPGRLTGTRWEWIPARRQPVKELHFWTASSLP